MFDRQPIGDDFTWMHSGQLGAPQMNGARGSEGQLLSVLDAALVNGFNIQTVSSVSISGSKVTLEFGVNHGFMPRQKISISGSDDPLLNGSHRVVDATINSVVIVVSGVSIATGVVKAKVAPLGFESLFGSTNPLKRAYRSTDLTSTRTVLYLDMALPDNHGYSSLDPVKRAMVTLCGDMQTLGIPINSYTASINNYDINVNGSMFWHQARDNSKTRATTSSENSNWVIVGNSKYFYLFQRWQTTNTTTAGLLARDFYAFGDVIPLSENDDYNCMWVGSLEPDGVSTTYFASNGSRIGNSTSDSIGFFIKSYNGVANATNFSLTTGLVGSTFSGNPAYPLPAINAPTLSMITMPSYALSTNGIRAYLPRLSIVPSTIADSLDLDITDNSLIVLMSASIGTTTSLKLGAYAIDLGD